MAFPYTNSTLAIAANTLSTLHRYQVEASATHAATNQTATQTLTLEPYLPGLMAVVQANSQVFDPKAMVLFGDASYDLSAANPGCVMAFAAAEFRRRGVWV